MDHMAAALQIEKRRRLLKNSKTPSHKAFAREFTAWVQEEVDAARPESAFYLEFIKQTAAHLGVIVGEKS